MTKDSPEAVENEVLMVISRSVITFDRYKVGTSAQESYNHLFGGGRTVDGDFNNDLESDNENIISRVKSNCYDTVFHIKLPIGPVFPIPYLNKYADKISSEIKSSNKIEMQYNYKVNLTAFVKYYKKMGMEWNLEGYFTPRIMQKCLRIQMH